MKEKQQRPGGRAEHVRQAVLTSAQELYVPGKNLPSLTDIASRAGVQRTTLYRRWGSTEAVLLDAVGDHIQKAIVVPNKGTLPKDLTALARATHDFHNSERGKDIVAMLLGAPDNVKQSYWQERYLALEKIFDRAVTRKEIAPQENWKFYLDLFIAPWYFCSWAKAEPWLPESAEQTIQLICSSLLL